MIILYLILEAGIANYFYWDNSKLYIGLQFLFLIKLHEFCFFIAPNVQINLYMNKIMLNLRFMTIFYKDFYYLNLNVLK